MRRFGVRAADAEDAAQEARVEVWQLTSTFPAAHDDADLPREASPGARGLGREHRRGDDVEGEARVPVVQGEDDGASRRHVLEAGRHDGAPPEPPLEHPPQAT
jgi:hypothetical protein